MAKVIFTFSDVVENGESKVALEGQFITDEEGGTVTMASVMGLAVKRLFETEWLGKNCELIVPEMFEQVKEIKNDNDTTG